MCHEEEAEGDVEALLGLGAIQRGDVVDALRKSRRAFERRSGAAIYGEVEGPPFLCRVCEE